MSSSAPSSSDVFETFCALASPGTPLTTPEVAAEFDCTDRTIYNKLDALAEDGRLETKKVGARGRVWWRAPSRSESNGGVEPETAHTGSDDTERVDEDSKNADTFATEAMFRRVFEHVPGLYLIVEPADYEIVAVSEAFLTATMTERAEILGKTLYEVFPTDPEDPNPEGVSRLRRSLDRVESTGESNVMPVTYYPIPDRESEDGGFEERWWCPTNSPVFDEAGEVEYIVHRVEDVTSVVRQLQADGEEELFSRLDARDSHLAADIVLRGKELHRAKERTYEQLRESERRYRTLFDSIEEGFCVIEKVDSGSSEPTDFRYVETNPAFERHAGVGDVVGKRIREVFPGESEDVYELYDRILRTGESVQFEYELETDDQVLEVSTFKVEHGEQQLGILFKDITERKEAERELVRTRDLLAKTERIADVAGWELDPETRAIHWTDHLFDLIGIPGDEEPSLEEVFSVFHEDDRSTLRDAVDTALESGKSYDMEARYRPVGGEELRWLTLQGLPEVVDGEVTTLRGAVQDITERKHRVEEIRETAEKLELATTAGRVGLWTLDMETDRISADAFIAETYGVDPGAADTGTPLEAYLEPVPEEERDRVRRAIERARTETDEMSVEHRIRDADGDWVWADVRAKMEYDEHGEQVRLNGTMIDITERKQRERLLDEQTELLERIASDVPLEVGLSALCAAVPRLGSGVRASITLADDDRESFERPIAPDLRPSWRTGIENAPIDDSMVGTCGEAVFQGESVTCEDIVGSDQWSAEWRELCLENGVNAAHSEPVFDANGEPVGSFMLCFDEPRTPTEWEHRLAEFGTHVAGIAVERDQSRRVLEEREASLERLNTAGRELIEASPDEIRERAATLSQRVLDVEYAALWRYNGTAGQLREAAVHDGGREAKATHCPEALSERAWQAFVGDGVKVVRDIDSGASSDSALRSGVLVPIGRHGVVCLGSRTRAAFDERAVDLAEAVGATLETAWDRAESERVLAERNEELQRLDRLNGLIRGVDSSLVDAATREDVDEAVCDRLARSRLYEFAWVGEYDAATDTIEPQEWAGVDSDYLERLNVVVEESSDDPTATAFLTGEMQVVGDVATDRRASPWRERTLARGGRSCIGIPLVYDDSPYGVLTVYGTAPQRDERETEVLSEFGERIAHAIDAIETRRALRTSGTVELTLRTAGANTPLCRLARKAASTIEFEGFVRRSADESCVFVRTRDGTSSDLLTASEALLAIRELTVLDDREDGSMFKARLSEPPLAARFAEQGARIRTLTVEDEAATAVVELPAEAGVRRFIEGVRRTVPDLELRARRSCDRATETPRTLQAVIEDRLTARQREVLYTAYLSGYFESPRAHTGREVAQTLGIAQPTFTTHLRGAERTVYAALFEHSGVE